MSGSEKDERKRLVREWKVREREEAEKLLPAHREVLVALFDALERAISKDGCDHSLRHTYAWAQAQGLDAELIANWTRQYGGYCDCEVLGNVRDSNPALSK